MKQNPSQYMQVVVLQGQGGRRERGIAWEQSPSGQVQPPGAAAFRQAALQPPPALTPAPPGSILSPTSDSSCLTAHSNPAQQFRQESEETRIQLKPQGGFREAEGNFPSWNMASIQGLISWRLGKQSWDLCLLRVILISVLSQIWKKGKRDKGKNPSKMSGLWGTA